MISKTVQINPYVILFIILSVSVLGTAWVGAQFERSSKSLDYAHAIPGHIKFVSGTDVKKRLNVNNRSESVSIVKKLDNVNPELTTRESYWYRYHTHLLPIAVGFFMLTLSAWSLIEVENLAMKVIER